MTDTSLFGASGNVMMSLQAGSAAAFWLNAARCVLSFGTRLVTEFGKVDRPVQFLPPWFLRFARNRGASLIASSALTLSAGMFALGRATLSGGGLDSYIPGMTMSIFGVSTLLFGVSASMDGGRMKPVLNAIATVAVSAGLARAAGPDVPLWMYAPFVAGAVSSVRLTFARNGHSHGGWQPDLYNAAGSLAAALHAFAAGHVLWAAANLFYAANMLTLHTLKVYGGIAEVISSRGGNPR